MRGESVAGPMLQCPPMSHPSTPEAASYRVTLFFGPEPVDGRIDVLACVFNVKKRSWKAGIQVSVEVGCDQLASIRQTLRLNERLGRALESVDAGDRPSCETRGSEYFAQAICRCKLDLRLCDGLAQDNQRIPAGDLVAELNRAAADRQEYVFSYIFTELDLIPQSPSASS